MPHSLLTANEKLQTIHNKITIAAQSSGRDAAKIQLLAVSKGQSLDKLEALYNAGQRNFGENYLQEALVKIRQLAKKEIQWHFIGRIQSNKTSQIAANFDWVHSLSSIAHAQKLNAHRSAERELLNICIQVNLSGEATKSGVSTSELESVAQQIAAMDKLKLRGLMTMPNPSASNSEQQNNYSKLQQLLTKFNQTGLNLDTLSMGMSNDYQSAIEAGATIVRVGTALFGSRESNNS